ncbi:MAG: nucleotidyltransferase domain-containing protein [Zestosphaera sp.]
MLTPEGRRVHVIREFSRRVAEWQEAFEEYVSEVCKSGLVKELYLAGSRARGNNMRSSDFDLVAVVDEDVEVLEFAERLRLLRKKSFSLDLLVLP